VITKASSTDDLIARSFSTSAPHARDAPRPRARELAYHLPSPHTSQENLILTKDQVRTLERAREEKQAHGEIETEPPGYLGAQDTYYVGTIKSIGRIYV
jgi:hypothetical protein